MLLKSQVRSVGSEFQIARAAWQNVTADGPSIVKQTVVTGAEMT